MGEWRTRRRFRSNRVRAEEEEGHTREFCSAADMADQPHRSGGAGSSLEQPLTADMDCAVDDGQITPTPDAVGLALYDILRLRDEEQLVRCTPAKPHRRTSAAPSARRLSQATV